MAIVGTGAVAVDRPPGPAHPVWARFRRMPSGVAALAGGLAAVVGVVSTIVTTIYLVRPNLAPSTQNKVAINVVTVEPRVTLRQYLAHPPVARELSPGIKAELLEVNKARADHVATVVHFQFEVTGYRGAHLSTRWSLFDADSGVRMGESEALDPVSVPFRAAKKDTDIGSWEVWVDTEGEPAAQYVVRIELYDDGVGERLLFKDSDKFAAPASR